CIMFETILAIITIYAYNLVASFPLELSSSGAACRSDRDSDRCRNHMDVQHLQLVEDFHRTVPRVRDPTAPRHPSSGQQQHRCDLLVGRGRKGMSWHRGTALGRST